MRPVECQFETDVLSAVLQSRWPDRVDDELRAHAAQCEICSDVVAVAGVIEGARDDLHGMALPDAGRVWWLARLRARREAAETASHAITATQVISLTCVVAVLSACFGATSLWFQAVLRSIAWSIAGLDFKMLLAEHGAIAAGLLVALLVVPAAVYWAIARE